MFTWMWQHQRRIIFGLVGTMILICGASFYVLALDEGCCAPLPSEAQDDPFELTGQLVFESDPTDFTGHFVRIAIMNADGTDYQTLTDYFEDGELQGYRPSSPVWSSDGERIALVASKMDAPSRLYVMNADGSELTMLAESETGWFSSPSWSPNGEQIIYGFQDGEDIELYILDLETLEATQLTDNEVDDSSPAWSPDGEWIVFNRELEGDFELFLMKLDGAETRQLTDNDTRDVYPAWSPDGSQVAFVSDREGEDAIYVLTLDDEDLAQIAGVPTLVPGRLAWSPDGGYIAYAAVVAQDNVDPDIEVHPIVGLYIVRLADGQSQPVPYGFVGWNASPSWVE